MDLAPRDIYYSWIVGFFFGVIFTGVLHIKLNNYYQNIDNVEQFGILTLLFLLLLFGLIFIVRKCKYVIEDPEDRRSFIYGDIVRHDKIARNRLTVKKIWKRMGLHKIYVGSISFYIISEEEIIDDYIQSS